MNSIVKEFHEKHPEWKTYRVRNFYKKNSLKIKVLVRVFDEILTETEDNSKGTGRKTRSNRRLEKGNQLKIYI